MADASDNPENPTPTGVTAKMRETAAAVKQRFAMYQNNPGFQLGDLVVWKEGLRNRRFPRENTGAIVTRIFPQPIFDPKKKDAGSPYFRENLDLVLGVFDTDGDFVEYHNDSCRFQKADETTKFDKRHNSVGCDGCEKLDFEGLRFKCSVCDDYDLCAACKFEGRTTKKHTTDHPMRMIEAPSPERLVAAFKGMCDEQAFKPGDLVTWKLGLKNKRRPSDSEFAVVVEVLPGPVFDSNKGASLAYFREPLDIRLGLLDEDGDFTVYHFDSRRFMKAM